MTKQAESRTFTFPLDVADDWPPVAAEGLVFEPDAKGWRLLVPPLFVKKLSVGDVLKIVESKGSVRSWSHLIRSKNTTLWLSSKTEAADDIVKVVLERVNKLGCQTVFAESLSSAAVSVP